MCESDADDAEFPIFAPETVSDRCVFCQSCNCENNYFQEWFASHMDTCVSTPFVPLFRKFESSKTTSSAAGSGASSTDGQVRVRYCVTYPEVQLQDRKKSKGEGGNASSSAPGESVYLEPHLDMTHFVF